MSHIKEKTFLLLKGKNDTILEENRCIVSLNSKLEQLYNHANAVIKL